MKRFGVWFLLIKSMVISKKQLSLQNTLESIHTRMIVNSVKPTNEKMRNAVRMYLSLKRD